jgi:hypothetical protein
MGSRKEIEFEVGQQSYRIVTDIFGDAIYGFNNLTQQVTIHKDLNSGKQIFVNWGNIAVLRFKDADGGA